MSEHRAIVEWKRRRGVDAGQGFVVHRACRKMLKKTWIVVEPC